MSRASRDVLAARFALAGFTLETVWSRDKRGMQYNKFVFVVINPDRGRANSSWSTPHEAIFETLELHGISTEHFDDEHV